RQAHPVFRRRRWFLGRAIHGADCNDIAWFSHTGEQASEEPWDGWLTRSLAIFISGETFPNPNARGEPVTDNSFYLIFNGHYEALDFTLPANRWGLCWLNVLDTVRGWINDNPPLQAGAKLKVAPRSIVLLQRQA
ncbi:MAG: glycogen debranching enzyme, partial [Pseudomonadota bacterium]|nr:glycogen debranching enzyme [Pseudomonadota bacterium]